MSQHGLQTAGATPNVFSLIKGVLEDDTDREAAIRTVYDLVSAALEHDDAFVNHRLAGGRLTFAEWKRLWDELSALAEQARQPGWRSTTEYEARMLFLERCLDGGEHVPTINRSA
jgi:hypothetical protein